MTFIQDNISELLLLIGSLYLFCGVLNACVHEGHEFIPHPDDCSKYFLVDGDNHHLIRYFLSNSKKKSLTSRMKLNNLKQLP